MCEILQSQTIFQSDDWLKKMLTMYLCSEVKDRSWDLQRQHCFASKCWCSLTECEVHTKRSRPRTSFTWRLGGQTVTGLVICLTAWMDDRMAGCLADVCPPLTYSHSVLLCHSGLCFLSYARFIQQDDSEKRRLYPTQKNWFNGEMVSGNSLFITIMFW